MYMLSSCTMLNARSMTGCPCLLRTHRTPAHKTKAFKGKQSLMIKKYRVEGATDDQLPLAVANQA